MIEIEILRTGTHTASSGQAATLGEDDLARIAAAYDPAYHEAPVVIGHPENDQPAYGWVKGLRAAGGKLLATLDLVPEFIEAIRQGLFKKRSASIYRDLDGKGLYLRHVGFLGAVPPAVKALADISLADWSQIIHFDFTEAQPMSWKDKAKKLFTAAVDEIPEGGGGTESKPIVVWPEPPAASFSEEDVRKREETAAKQAREQAELEFADKMRKVETDRAHAAHAIEVKTKIDLLVASPDGKITPAMVKSGLIEFAQSLPYGPDAVVDFAEDQKLSPCDWFLNVFLPGLPKQIEFGEVASRNTDMGKVEPSLQLHRMAMQKQKDNPSLSYADAVQAASIDDPSLMARWMPR